MLTIFTDGSSRGNPGPGGWGVILVNDATKEIKELGGRDSHTTNNRMELTAAINALKNANLDLGAGEGEEITIYTDSSYLINGVTKWVEQWKKINWVTRAKEEVLNRDLWEALDAERKGKKIYWKYVGGHVGVPGNERCDEIATAFADEKEIKLFKGTVSSYTIPNILDVKISIEKSDTKSRSKAKAYSYVSKVEGKILVHHSWAECEKRVKGVKGARFKKAVNPEDEEKIRQEFSML